VWQGLQETELSGFLSGFLQDDTFPEAACQISVALGEKPGAAEPPIWLKDVDYCLSVVIFLNTFTF